MRPGFLGNTDYWFSKRLGDAYEPQILTPWHEEFYVEEPFYEKYLKQAEWARLAKKTTQNND